MEDKQPVVTSPPQGEPTQGDIPASLTSMLTITPASYDCGTITATEGTVSTSFEVMNKGNKPIKITEITTSCGSTTAEISALELAPDASSTLKVSFNPNFHKEPEGRFSRTIFLQTSEGVEIQAKIYVEIEG